MSTMSDLDASLDELVDDGDTIEVGCLTFRLRIEQDEWPVLDLLGDGFGELAPVESSRTYAFDQERPHGFNGNAEKIHVGRSHDGLWWQPPADGPKRGTCEFSRMRSHLLALLEDGFHVVAVEVLEGADHYDRPIVRDAASVGAVDLSWCDMQERQHQDEHLAELVRELVSELLERI